jgi:hypothetical protein
LQDLKIFECLNAEKAMPHFLNIAKKTKGEANLSDVKKENGEDFTTDKERNEHIVKFFSDLYREDPQVGGSIQDFLGPEIANKPHI